MGKRWVWALGLALLLLAGGAFARVGALTAQNSYLQRVEAEAGQISAPLSSVRDESASACYYLRSAERESGVVTLTLTVPHDDLYYLWARVLGPGYTSNSFWVSLDGEDEFWYEISPVGPSWFWDPLHAEGQLPTAYYLAAGAHALRLRAREPNAQLDEVLLTSYAGYVPSAADVTSCLAAATTTATPSPTATRSVSPTGTATSTLTRTITPTPTRTATASATWTSTPTRSRTPTLTPSASATAPFTLTPTPTALRLFLPLVWR